MKTKLALAFALIMLIACTTNCLAQGQITRPTKQTTAPAAKPAAKPHAKTNTVKVHYSNPDGYYNNHGYVDLGLPSGTKWATCNIGSATPEKTGTYFAWGETSPKATYTDANSVYALKRPAGLLQNNRDLAPSHDAAHVNWGGPWRMPTRAEIDELVNRCKWQWVGAPAGMLVTGPNGKTIFLAATGAKSGTNLITKDKGCLWTSTVGDSADNSNAYELDFSQFGPCAVRINRCYGLNIRPVCK